MKEHQNMFLLSLVFIPLLLFGACNFDFLNAADEGEDGESCATETRWSDSDGDGVDDTGLTYDCHGALLWKELHQHDEDGNVIAKRRLDPQDRVVWTYLYSHASGQMEMEAYFLPEEDGHQLQWYTIFTYENGKLVQKDSFDGSGTFQWAEAWDYDPHGNPLYRGRFDASREAQWLYSYSYDGEGRTSEEISYTAPSDGSGRSFSASRAGTGLETPLFGLALPEPPADLPELPLLSGLPDGMEELWRKQYWYHSGASFSVKYKPGELPLPLEMTAAAPDVLEEDVKITISYDEDADPIRPVRKVTTYGDTEVLDLGFEYNAAGLPSRVTTAGELLFLPLDYEISYNEDHFPQRISIFQGETLLQYLEYSYHEADGTESAGINYLDPLDFGGKVHIITLFDGDGVVVGSFAFTYDDANSQIRIDAYEGSGAEKRENGYFLLSLNTEGETAAFSGFSEGGERVWHYEYEYDEVGNRIMEMNYDASDALALLDGFSFEQLLFE